jgi:lipoate-protein ligase A
VPGEYCPGEYSVNARGARKLMGVGQRVIRGAAHVGGVIVVRDSNRVRAALEPVYDAMQVDWDPETAGSVEDELGMATREAVVAALLAELRLRVAIEAGDGFPLDAALVRATALEARFAIESA